MPRIDWADVHAKIGSIYRERVDETAARLERRIIEQGELIARLCEALKVTWIPCEERWPTKTDLYWVCWHECLRRKKPMIAEWLQRGKVWYLEGKYYRPGTVLAPSHWAEVDYPEPPAG